MFINFHFLNSIWFRFSSLIYGLVGTAPILDTQNPGISGFSTAHAYKYKTQTASKNEAMRG